MYKSILLPIDLTHLEKSRLALNIAKGMADKTTKTRLVNVVDDIPTFVAAELPGGVIEKSKEKATAELTDLAKKTCSGADIEVRSGTPYAAILAAAGESGADLIIIGSHQPGIQDYLLGSTASRVVRHANCSVLVVR